MMAKNPLRNSLQLLAVKVSMYYFLKRPTKNSWKSHAASSNTMLFWCRGLRVLAKLTPLQTWWDIFSHRAKVFWWRAIPKRLWAFWKKRLHRGCKACVCQFWMILTLIWSVRWMASPIICPRPLPMRCSAKWIVLPGSAKRSLTNLLMFDVRFLRF